MLKNIRFAGQEVVTQFGRVKYDEDGIASGLTEEQEKVFKDINGYEFEESKEKESKKNKKDKEKKKEKKEDKFSKKYLEDLTVDEIEDLAEGLGIKLEDGLKKDKINRILEEQ